MAGLPSEIMYDILSGMPMKSLAQFRCVSNIWRNYINDPYFETIHVKRPVISDPMLIMFQQIPSVRPNSPCKISFPEYKEEAGSCTIEVTKKPPVMEFMCRSWDYLHPKMIILGCCNGLICSLKYSVDGTPTLIVINPLRRECYELPSINKPMPFHIGLGFDDSTNTFKMVCVMPRKKVEPPNLHLVKEDLCTMVHVLGTRSRREIPQVPTYPICGEGVFANGCLHWLTRYEPLDHDHDDFHLIRFDMKTEEFVLIKPPKIRTFVLKVHLLDLHGQVGLVYMLVNYSVEVWVLKETGWVKHCEFEEKPPLSRGCVRVLGFWNEDGDIVMTNNRIRKQLFVYNIKNGSLYESNVVAFEGAEIDFRMYRSTLFSTHYSVQNQRKKRKPRRKTLVFY